MTILLSDFISQYVIYIIPHTLTVRFSLRKLRVRHLWYFDIKTELEQTISYTDHLWLSPSFDYPLRFDRG